MNKKQIKELRDRWTQELDFEINSCLREREMAKANWKGRFIENNFLPTSPFGLTEKGHIDFRGFPFRAGFMYKTLINIDFSYSTEINYEDTPGYGDSTGWGFLYSSVENCLFIGAEMPYRLHEKFINCDFSGARFKSSEFGNIFDSCLFVKSKIVDGRSTYTKFTNCDFTEANFLKSDFARSYFDNCIFDDTKFTKTNLSGSTFVNTRPSDEQLASPYFSYGGEVFSSKNLKFK